MTVVLLLLISLFSGCFQQQAPSDPSSPVQYTEVDAGLDFEHYNGFSGEYYYVETFGPGSAFFDYDNDGDQDIFVVNQRPVNDMSYRGGVVGSKLYRNDSSRENNWLKIKLKGNQSTTRGLGARIRVVCDDLSMIREVDGGSSHASQNSSIIHFGLGENKKVDSLIVTWPGGKKEYLINLIPNNLIEIEETIVKKTSFIDSFLEYFNLN
mgnify:CR=1 FL=1